MTTPPDDTAKLTSPAVVGPGYAAVYEVIRQWPGTAERNAVIWRAVQAYEAATGGTTPPDDTTEGLRERIAWAIARYDWEHGLTGNGEIGPHQRGEADAVLAALAGDPGDLPARMAEAIAEYWEGAESRHDGFEVTKAAAAALSVHWEHAVSQAAEVERLRAHAAEEPAPCPVDHQCEGEQTCGCWCDLHDVPIAECPTFQLVDSWTSSRDAEVERLRAALAEVEAEAARRRGEIQLLRVAADPAKVGAVGDLVKHATRLVQIERDDARAERDALKAAIEKARERLNWLIANGFGARTDTLVELLAALDAPETLGETADRPREDTP